MAQQAWNVFVGTQVIDTVYYDKDIDKDRVRDSLINHDGYPAGIQVAKPAAPRKPRRIPF